MEYKSCDIFNAGETALGILCMALVSIFMEVDTGSRAEMVHQVDSWDEKADILYEERLSSEPLLNELR